MKPDIDTSKFLGQKVVVNTLVGCICGIVVDVGIRRHGLKLFGCHALLLRNNDGLHIVRHWTMLKLPV